MLDCEEIKMRTINIVLRGPPYSEPRYYGKLQWSDRDVYIRHPGGGYDTRHRNGKTYLKSTSRMREVETRVKTSDVSREFVNYVTLSSALPEPRVFTRTIGPNDLVLKTTEAGAKPRLAVEIVENSRLAGVLNAWKSHSSAPNVQAFFNKGLGQSLVVAVAGSLTVPPTTGLVQTCLCRKNRKA